MPQISMLIKPASGNCEYRCEYCFYADVMANRETANLGFMSAKTLESLTRGALAYADGGVNFGFQGGEPTLCGLEFYENAVALQKRYFKGARVTNSIQTNGGLINDEWARFFSKHGFLVGLSIDGAAQTHDAHRVDARGAGTHARALEAAQTLARAGVEFNILCVVTRDVANEPAKTYEALRQFRYIQFIPCIDDFDTKAPRFSPDAREYANFLIETFKLYRRDIEKGEYVSVRAFDNYIQMLIGARPESCGMSGRCACYFVVEANGDVYPCDFYVLDKWRLGNINIDSLSSLARSERACAFVSQSVYVSPECRACSYFALCRGGCRRHREPFGADNMPSLNKYCLSYKEFFGACLTDMRALAAKLRR